VFCQFKSNLYSEIEKRPTLKSSTTEQKGSENIKETENGHPEKEKECDEWASVKKMQLPGVYFVQTTYWGLNGELIQIRRPLNEMMIFERLTEYHVDQKTSLENGLVLR